MQKFSATLRHAAALATVLAMSCLCACSDDDNPGRDPNPDPDPAPDPTPAIVLTTPLEGKVFFEKGVDADNYYIGLYTGDIEIYTSDDGSIWIPSDDRSRLLYLDLYAAPGAAADAIVLPEGTYRIADDPQAGSAYREYTYGLWYFGSQVDYADATGGDVTVVRTEKGYRITAELEMVRSSTKEALGKLNFVYEGPLDFEDISKPEPDDEYPPLKEAITTAFVGVDAAYMGIPAYSSPIDLYVLDLYDGEAPLPNGTIADGNLLHLELYTEHQGYYPGEKNIALPADTYPMTDGYVPVEKGIGTGDKWDSGYGIYPYGSYLLHRDEKTGTIRYGFLGEGGQVTVTVTGDTYTVDAKLKTRQGLAVNGTYTGKLDLRNEAQEPERQKQSRIYEDKVLDLTHTASAEVTFRGTSHNDMTHFYHIFAQDPASRQGFQLELLAPVGEVGELAGTYKPSEVLVPLRMVPYTYIPGDIQLVAGGAAMIGTWGYYETNAAGKAVAFAPALTGDVVVGQSTGQDGKMRYTIRYVLTDDDLEEPHTMTAEFEGTFDITDATASAAAKHPERFIPSQQRTGLAPIHIGSRPQTSAAGIRHVKAQRIAR